MKRLAGIASASAMEVGIEGQSGGVAFENTRAALSSETTGTVAQSSPEVQSGVVQQAGSAYTQVEQQAGQALDITG